MTLFAFQCSLTVKDNGADGRPNFLGPLVQGPPAGRFVYIDVGECAGQKGSPWARRIKVPLTQITWALIERLSQDPQTALEAALPGTARDGGPACATVAPSGGWRLVRLNPP